jgi:fructose-1,6-bisphosphatase II
MKNFHMDLIRVTEAGAISAAEWVGRGDKESADKAATDAMRGRLNQVDFAAEIAIGEGIKDESYGLFEGERLGLYANKELVETGQFPVSNYSIAVDPIEGTTPTVKGGYEAMSVISMGEKDALYKTEYFYMDKIAVGPKVAASSQIDLRNPASANVGMVAAALGKSPQHVCVCVMDRPRTQPLVKELREIGCRIKFISDCDVTACIAACVPDSGIDIYWSIGGAPEAVIAACAMKCMGGFLQCREVEDTWLPANDTLLSLEDLAAGEVMFAGTGITDGKLLKGVRFTGRGPVTNSIAMRSGSQTVRRMFTEHGN